MHSVPTKLARVTGWPVAAASSGDTVYVNASWLAALAALDEPRPSTVTSAAHAAPIYVAPKTVAVRAPVGEAAPPEGAGGDKPNAILPELAILTIVLVANSKNTSCGTINCPYTCNGMQQNCTYKCSTAGSRSANFGAGLALLAWLLAPLGWLLLHGRRPK